MVLTQDGRLLFLTRFVRLFSYGMLAVVLVFYLTGLGLSEPQTGLRGPNHGGGHRSGIRRATLRAARAHQRAVLHCGNVENCIRPVALSRVRRASTGRGREI